MHGRGGTVILYHLRVTTQHLRDFVAQLRPTAAVHNNTTEHCCLHIKLLARQAKSTLVCKLLLLCAAAIAKHNVALYYIVAAAAAVYYMQHTATACTALCCCCCC